MDPDPINREQRSLYGFASTAVIMKKILNMINIGCKEEGDPFDHPNRSLCRNTFLFSNNPG